MFGHPGSGKTQFALNLVKKYNFLHLNTDDAKFSIFEKPTHSRKEVRLLFKIMDYFASLFLRNGFNLIYDANFTKRVFRKRLADLAEKYGAKLIILCFKVPIKTAVKRVKTRHKNHPGDLKKFFPRTFVYDLHRIKNEEEHPVKGDEVFFEIDGTKSFADQVKPLLKYLKKA